MYKEILGELGAEAKELGGRLEQVELIMPAKKPSMSCLCHRDAFSVCYSFYYIFMLRIHFIYIIIHFLKTTPY